MVRLVFRPYAQVGRSICTSESLRASTRVSPGFALLRRRSPSIGSRRLHSCSDKADDAATVGPAVRSGGSDRTPWRSRPRPRKASRFHFAVGFSGNPAARTGVGLLGPCFKTGRAGTGITPYTFRRTGATRATEAARTAAVARGRPRHPRLLSCQSRPEPPRPTTPGRRADETVRCR